MKPTELSRRSEHVDGWTLTIVSFKLGDRYHCSVDNTDPGARLARGEGETRLEAEEQAVTKARRMLARTRRPRDR